MDSKLSFLKEIDKIADKQKVFDLLCMQLENDFLAFGLQLPSLPKEESNFALLPEKLTPLLKHLESQMGNQLSSFMYRVDVNQNRYEGALAKPTSERYLLLAWAVLNRTLKKVLTKMYYAQ